ncbi:hypothetical protein [Streptomyces sp. SID8352]|uniref:hypothetical protein n=1 Tax=Streptomyces sp. SID8352 TaxID=2690338 RepID=UPI001925B112|nr:hypothetical protein [Streptomyces sp. SID8352]
MGSTVEVRHATARVEEAEDIVRELRELLAAAGVTPPSPGPGPVTPAGEAPRPPVEPVRRSGTAARRPAAVPR